MNEKVPTNDKIFKVGVFIFLIFILILIPIIHQNSYRVGYDSGYNVGFDDGYQDGMEHGLDSLFCDVWIITGRTGVDNGFIHTFRYNKTGGSFGGSMGWSSGWIIQSSYTNNHLMRLPIGEVFLFNFTLFLNLTYQDFEDADYSNCERVSINGSFIVGQGYLPLRLISEKYGTIGMAIESRDVEVGN